MHAYHVRVWGGGMKRYHHGKCMTCFVFLGIPFASFSVSGRQPMQPRLSPRHRNAPRTRAPVMCNTERESLFNKTFTRELRS